MSRNIKMSRNTYKEIIPNLLYIKMSEILTFYKNNHFVLTSGNFEPYYNEEKNKLEKNFKHITSWKTKPIFNKSLNGHALLTGKNSNITAIDIDDPTLEHNKELIKVLDKHCNLVQRTKKGFHYLFKYTDKLRTTTSTIKALDIRNDNALLYVEPSNYTYKNHRYKYEFITMPVEDEDIKPITEEIIDLIFKIYGIDEKAPLKIKETNKEITKELKNIKVETEIDLTKIRMILDNINIKRFDDYSSWLHLAIILKRCKAGSEIFEEYSKKSSKYKENEPFNIYNSIDPSKYDININTLYFWLKQDNKEKFMELVFKNDEYQIMKETIEKDYIIVGPNFYKRLNDRKGFMILKEAEIKLELKPYKIEIFDEEKNKKVKIDFYKKWIEDKDHYKFVDFIPNIDCCPKNTFNLFDGFEAEKHFDLIKNFTFDDIEKKVRIFIDHIKILTNNNEEYFIKWLAHIVQKPYIKEGTTPLFRDKGQFINSGGGTGKNLFFDNFGEKVLGEKYYITIGTNNELYNSFNEHLENKLLVCIEEAQGKSNFENFDRLKSIITQTKTTVNRKFVSKYTINDYSRYIFCSNNDNPIPIDNNDRRFFCYDVNTKKRNNEQYFKKLSDAFNDKISIACFLKHLLNFKTYEDPVQFQIYRPITRTYIELKRLNAPIITKWLISYIKTTNKKDEYRPLAEYFIDFNNWVEFTKNKKSDITVLSFSRFLTSDSEIFSSEDIDKVKASVTKIKLNITNIKIKLKEKLYLDDNETNFIDF
jgi:hypothetical protein